MTTTSISEWLYAATQEPRDPLSRVSRFYLVLGVPLILLAAFGPEWLWDIVTGPDTATGFLGDFDQFEPVAVARPAEGLRGFLEHFSSLMAALLLMLPVSWVYMGTRQRAGFDQSIAQTMLILPIAVAGIVMVVHDSIALAFSLAGIVAAVRFRNTLRSTGDALFIFTAIGVGLACGIGALGVAALVSVFFNYTILLLWRCDYGVCPKAGPRAEYSSGLLFPLHGFDGGAALSGLDAERRKRQRKQQKKAAKQARELEIAELRQRLERAERAVAAAQGDGGAAARARVVSQARSGPPT